MASGKTDTHENAVINHFCRGTGETTKSAYIALFSTAPGEAGGGVELSGNGYARIAIGLNAPSDGVALNGGEVKFTAAGGAWSAIDGHAVMDESSAGNMQYYEDSVGGPTLGDGDSYQFDAGDISVTET
ncbi:MAG: hypothetical protein JRJ45_00605 [Deltaproteobacteria bacterium]|nr:hypothetical protein [Deltaproteobacteria bacterium]